MNKSLSFFEDENIPTDLINWIKAEGYEISSVTEENLQGAPDLKSTKKVCF